MRLPERKERLRVVPVGLCVLGACFFLLFPSFSRSLPSVANGVLFLSALFVLFYLPGNLLLRLLRLAPSALEDLVFSLSLGMLVATLLFFVVGLLGVDRYLLLAIFFPIAAGWMAHAWVCPWAVRRPARFPWLLLIPLALALATLIFCSYTLLVREPDGSMLISRRLCDGLFHNGIVNEVDRAVPPRMPFCSGYPLVYHYAMDLGIVLIHKVTSIETLDLIFHYFPTFYLTLLILSAFVLGRRYGRSQKVGALFAVLFFATDFSFVLPLLPGCPQRFWWNAIPGAPTLISTYVCNPMLPAWIVLFSALLSLLLAVEKGKRGWVLLGGVFAASLFFYKIFTYSQLLGALLLSALFTFKKRAGKVLLGAFLFSFAISIPLAAYSYFFNPTSFRIGFYPLGWYYYALSKLELEPGLAGKILLFPVYLVCLLGVRVIALPSILKGMRRGGDPFRSLLSWFIIIGLGFFLFVRVYPGYNNASWYGVASLVLLWLFVAATVSRWLSRERKVRSAMVLLLLVALGFPSTVQFFFYISTYRYMRVSPQEVEAARFLRERAGPHDVVLHAFNRRGLAVPAHIAGKRVVVCGFKGYVPRLIGDAEEFLRRKNDVDAFFSTADIQEAKEILRRYGVSWVYLGPRDRIWFDDEGILYRVFRSRNVRICKVL